MAVGACQAGNRDTTLVLLSDMIQATRTASFQDLAGIPNEAWLKHIIANNLVPHLSKVCVTIAGADSSTQVGAARHDFWQRYFFAAGANFDQVRYRRTVTEFDSVLCST